MRFSSSNARVQMPMESRKLPHPEQMCWMLVDSSIFPLLSLLKHAE
jgi:hypothetical protein